MKASVLEFWPEELRGKWHYYLLLGQKSWVRKLFQSCKGSFNYYKFCNLVVCFFFFFNTSGVSIFKALLLTIWRPLSFPCCVGIERLLCGVLAITKNLYHSERFKNEGKQEGIVSVIDLSSLVTEDQVGRQRFFEDES